MTPGRLAASLGGATLLVAWLANAGAVPKSAQVAAPRAQADDGGLDALVSDVQSHAARLRQRLAEAPAPIPPVRNPFSFRPRAVSSPAPAHRVLPGAASADAADAIVPELALTFDGVAEQHAPDGSVVRTAIVTGAGDQVFMVTEGQTIADRYSVVAVTPDVLELKDLTTGATRRFSLKSSL